MTIGQFDLALRAGAASAMLMLGWLLVRRRRELGLPGALFAPLALCVASFVVGNTPLVALRPAGLAGSIAHALSGFAVIFVWWFCLSCFDSRFRLRGPVLAVGLAWGVIAALDRGLLGAGFAELGLSRGLVVLGLGIVAHLVWRLLSERADDLVQRRHDARIIVAVLLGGMLFVDLSADVLFGFEWRPMAFAMTQNAMVLGFALWLAGTLLTVKADLLTFGAEDGAPPSAAPPPGEGWDRDLHRRLLVLMETERVFLVPDLTFAAFVARMGASERAVRTLINRDLGYDHFRTFLNHYRVAEARRRLADPSCDDKLVAVAMDSGFASLASFNRAFKQVEDCAPSAYRAAARQVDPVSQKPGSEERGAAF